MSIQTFGYGADGRRVDAIRLSSGRLSATILTRGSVIQDVRLEGVGHSLTFGASSVAAYEGPFAYFGSMVGPVANRIAGAEATIGESPFRFAANEGTTLLHGGEGGLHTRHWAVEAANDRELRLGLVLGDGDDGFPGRRVLRAAWHVDGATLGLDLTATTDAPTLINLANHGYWNMDGTPSVVGHRLRIAADHYLPVDNALIPTGEVRAVQGAFDLRGGRALDGSERFDHNFCLANAPRALTEAATLTGRSGVTMTIATTEPGLQVYDAARLSTAPQRGHSGQPYGAHAGVAMEPQRWPDAPHHPAFPSILLHQGETYRQQTEWRFSA